MNKSEYMKEWRIKNADKVKEYNKKAVQDYSQGKIYAIKCNITGIQYIGSTKEKYLSRRLQRHTQNYKYYLESESKKGYMTSFEVIKNGDCVITLIEKFPCQNKKELHTRERFHIENCKCVNKVVPTRTTKEKIKFIKDNEPELYKIRYNKKREVKYHYCEVCKIKMRMGSKKRHESRETHLKNVM